MTPTLAPRPLPVLAVGIVDAHKAFLATATSALEHAKQAGELLSEAKSQLHHGEWLPWLQEHCPNISPRVAQGYMRIAREWPQLLANTKRVSYLPIRDALTILADEWTDPDELGAGGSDNENGCGTGDDENDDDGCGTRTDRTDRYARMFRLFFDAKTFAAFRQDVKELKPYLRTQTNTATIREAVRLVRASMDTKEANTTKDEDADDPTHTSPLDAGH
jgi:hypothetical protein